MKEQLQVALRGICQEIFGIEIHPELSRPDEQFGDYSTNVALQLAKRLGRAPQEVAEELVGHLKEQLAGQVRDITIAGPGFINIRLADAVLLKAVQAIGAYHSNTYLDKVIVAEYSDPNPFKSLHAGHLYTSVVGDAIANLFERGGGIVHRVNFGGDVGLHVAKSIWAILQNIGGELPEKLQAISPEQRASWLSTRYVEGNEAYETNDQVKQEIVVLNKRVYQLHEQQDHTSPLAQIYWTCRQWSYDYFDEFYQRIGTHFEKYYPESQTASIGLATVQEQLKKGVYEQSEGAVIFRGEKYGLYTEVFINSAGLPTYAAKDVGLIMTKWQDYHFDRSVIITGNDIVEYMKVVLKSIEQFRPELSQATTHLTHGIVKLKGGTKMSSRKGNVLRAEEVLRAAAQANQELTGKDNEETTLGAVKYAFLKNRLGGDIIYDPSESVSLAGNSGPYIQYAHARARSILDKAVAPESEESTELQANERGLALKISAYPEVMEQAMIELLPHYICTYLYELATVFNRFYEHNRVIGDERQSTRLYLVHAYAEVLKAGLELLNIPAPQHL